MGILRICILVVVVVVRTRDLPLSYAGPCRLGGSRSASDASPSFRYGGVGALIKVPTADQTQTLPPPSRKSVAALPNACSPSSPPLPLSTFSTAATTSSTNIYLSLPHAAPLDQRTRQPMRWL